jgi:hypothetical protein
VSTICLHARLQADIGSIDSSAPQCAMHVKLCFESTAFQGSSKLSTTCRYDTNCRIVCSAYFSIITSTDHLCFTCNDRLQNAAPTNPENHGDILTVLPSGLVVADVSVVHLAATSYSHATTLLVLLLHPVMHSSCISIMLAVSPLPSRFIHCQWSLTGV